MPSDNVVAVTPVTNRRDQCQGTPIRASKIEFCVLPMLYGNVAEQRRSLCGPWLERQVQTLRRYIAALRTVTTWCGGFCCESRNAFASILNREKRSKTCARRIWTTRLRTLTTIACSSRRRDC